MFVIAREEKFYDSQRWSWCYSYEMPPKRQRLWNEANMKAAMLAIQRKQMGFLKDQQTYIMSQEIHCFDLLSA